MKRTSLIVGILVLLCGSSALGQRPIEEGKQLYKSKKYTEAVAALRGAVTLYPREAQGWLYLAKSFLKTSLPDSAEAAATRSRTLDDEDPEVYLTLSEAQLAQKNLAGAYASARAGLKARKEYAPLVTQLGFVQLAGDSADAALISFTRAKELDPNSALAFEGLGDAYLRQGVTPLAITQYERSIDIDSVQPGVLYKLANAHLKERQYNDAVRIYQKVVNEDPENQAALFELGRIYYRARQFVNAARTFRTYMSKNPNSQEAMAMFVESLYLSRQYKEALPLAQKMNKADPKNLKWLRILAHASLEDKKFDQAIEGYSKLAASDTLEAEDYKRWGRAYLETKRDSLAAVTFEESLKRDTTQAALYGDVGAIWMKLRQWSRAADNFARRFGIDSTASSAYINYSLCMMALEDFEKSSWALEQAIQQNPQYPPAYTKLGLSYFQQKKYPEARKAYETAVKVIDTAETKYRSELAEASRMTGLTLLLEKKFEDGIPFLRKSLQYKDDDAQTHVWLAQALQNAQKRDEAIKEYKRVLKIDPNNKEAKKGLEILDPK
ncbi:MAG: tetratricopeptide repeat protein [Bacteroidota bacterium]